MRIGSLCTGYGGLDMAVEQVLGGELAWTSDIDPGACKIIAHRFPHAPNLGDFTKIDWAGVEPVDILSAGWPCQPFSQAGKRKGAADERALWPEVARAVRALRPRYVVLENVSAIATAGELERATASLAALGYVGSWLCLRASDVGAPHRRERIFIIAADAESVGRERVRPTRIRRPRSTDSDLGPVALLPTPVTTDSRWASGGDLNRNSPGLRAIGSLLPTPTVTNSHGNERNGRGEPTLPGVVKLLPTPRATDGTKGGPNQRGSSGDPMLPSAVVQQFGQYAEAIARWTLIIGREAPEPTIKDRLNPRFVEWMQGCPDGWVCAVPNLSRSQQLKALGNGVVPQQAVAAISHMISRQVAA